MTLPGAILDDVLWKPGQIMFMQPLPEVPPLWDYNIIKKMCEDV